MARHYVFTSESVTAGHPDKLCDQISDELVGHFLRQDRLARVAAECAVSTGILFVSVKASSDATVDVPNAARAVILDVGYDKGAFNGHNCTIMTSLNQLEGDDLRFDELAMSEAELDELAVLDNVTAFGYACTHTPELLPLPVWLAHRVVRRLDLLRQDALDYLAPDGACQVGVAFQDQTPYRIHSVTLVASQQRKKKPELAELRNNLLTHVIEPAFAESPIGLDEATRININPEGAVFKGGPTLHAGLTGRKNGIDAYGGFSRQSGAALSGKDPSRIDRVAAYAARHAAKNVVAAGLAEQCEVQLSYTIGLAHSVSVRADSFGTGVITDDDLTERVRDCFDFRLGGIMRRFDLRRLARSYDGEFYRRLAVYGHIGRTDLAAPWELVEDAHSLR